MQTLFGWLKELFLFITYNIIFYVPQPHKLEFQDPISNQILFIPESQATAKINHVNAYNIVKDILFKNYDKNFKKIENETILAKA